MTPAGNTSRSIYRFAGYLLLDLFDRFLTAYVCDKPQTAEYALGLVPLIGIGFHSLLDGVVYSISFSVSPLTGTLVAVGMVLHEFPEGIVTYTLLLRSGFTPRRSMGLAFMEPPGPLSAFGSRHCTRGEWAASISTPSIFACPASSMMYCRVAVCSDWVRR